MSVKSISLKNSRGIEISEENEILLERVARIISNEHIFLIVLSLKLTPYELSVKNMHNLHLFLIAIQKYTLKVKIILLPPSTAESSAKQILIYILC